MRKVKALVLSVLASACGRFDSHTVSAKTEPDFAPALELADEDTRAAGWNDARSVISGTKGGIFRYPSVAFRGEEFFVAGIDIADYSSDSVTASSLTIASSSGVKLNRPGGEWTFGYPRLAVDGLNRIHLIWAESSQRSVSVSATRWPSRPMTSIWDSTLDNRNRWSEPVCIVRGKHIDWGFHFDGFTSRSVDGPAIIATRWSERGETPVPLLLVLGDSSWRVLPSPVLFRRGLGSAYVSTVSAVGFADSEIVLATLSDDGNGEEVLATQSLKYPSNSLGANRLATTWSNPEVHAVAGRSQTIVDVVLTVSSLGIANVGWVQSQIEGSSKLEFRSRSLNSERWKVRPFLLIKGRPTSIHAISNSVNDIFVVFGPDPYKDEQVLIRGARLSSTWSEIPALFRAAEGRDVALFNSPKGEQLLVFTRTAGGKVRTYWSVFTHR